jgi:hypothetical protein
MFSRGSRGQCYRNLIKVGGSGVFCTMSRLDAGAGIIGLLGVPANTVETDARTGNSYQK